MIQQQAPDFTAQALLPAEKFGDDPSIGSLNLSQYRGKWVILFFYPLNFTFICPTEITSFADRHAEFEALNCQLIAASCDSIYTHLAWCKTKRIDGGLGLLRIPLVADFDKAVATSYNVLLQDGSSLRASFLISPDGVVRHVTMNDLPVGRNVDEMVRLLKAFQFVEEHGDVCPANWQPGSATMKADPEQSKEYFHTAYSQPEGHQPTKSPVENAGEDVTRVSFRSSVVVQDKIASTNIFYSLYSHYASALQTSPLITKAITSAVISIIGEMTGSYLLSRRPGAQPRTSREMIHRAAVFGSYGLLVTGPLFHWWYGALETVVQRMNLPFNDLGIIVKLALNQLVMTPPFLLLTLAYLQYFLSLNATQTVRNVKNSFAAALFTNWKVWTVAQAVNFKFVPLQYRVLFGNVIALWWNIYLSMVNSQK
eukprot:gene40954-49958_t